MFSSKYLLDKPINNILFASVHGHNHLDSKWSLTHEWWKGFSCRGKDKNIFLKRSWCYCQLLLSVSSFLLMHECIFSMKITLVKFTPFSYLTLSRNLMFVTLELRIIWSECSLQRTEAGLWWENWFIIYVICQMCQAHRILHLLIQYHTRFDNGEISWNLGTENQALTLKCEIIKLAAIGNGRLCGYFPFLAFSALKLFPAFMVAKDSIMNASSSAQIYSVCVYDS